MKIKSLELDNAPLFAPMAGVSDVIYRNICSTYGAAVTYTEMVSALGLFYNPEKANDLRLRGHEEKISGLQIFGNNPKVISDMAKKYSAEFDLVDVNMGCPAPKIVKNNQGSALMKSPSLASDIIKALVDVIGKPITIKIRSGWNENLINAVEFAGLMEDAGASAITIHARHREQFYSGKADLNIIKKVKEAINIPVIGNGDIFKPEDAINMLKLTNCDNVMIARGAQGNPFIFSDVKKLMNNQLITPHTMGELIKIIKEHAEGLNNLFGERHMALKMRKHLSWYAKGIRNVTSLKKLAVQVSTFEDIKSFCKQLETYSKNN